MILLILLGLTFFVQLLATPWFVMVETAGDNSKALKYRLLCSGIVIADVMLCGAIAQAHNHPYFILIGAGSVLSFAAGIIACKLMLKGDLWFFILQSGANLLCTLAFTTQLYTLYNAGLADIISWVVPLIMAIILIPFMCKQDGKYRPHLILSVLSAVLLCGKAIHLGILCQKTGLPTMQAVSCALIMGSLALSFAVLLTTRQQISPPPEGKPQLPKYCTYFFGQMLIACSILICGGLK